MNFIVKNVNLIKYDAPKKINTDAYVYDPKTKKSTSKSQLEAKSAKAAKASSKKSSSKTDNTSLGKCPVCGSDVVETEKGFLCTNYQTCKYGIFKDDKYLALFKKNLIKQWLNQFLKKVKQK